MRLRRITYVKGGHKGGHSRDDESDTLFFHTLGARGPGTSDYMLRTLRALVE